MDQLTVLFLLFLLTLVAMPLAERLRLPYPVVITVGGLLLAVLPGVSALRLNPDLLLPLLLPPLLHTAGWRTSWREFVVNAKAILLLAVALVFVTTAAVAYVARLVVPDLPVAAAVALGALVAPPDPVAASAVAATMRLPRRLVSILESEGLFNDVTAVVLYQVAVAAAVTGSFSAPEAAGKFVLSAVVACAVGWGVSLVARYGFQWLGDPRLRVLGSLLLPFVAYIGSDELGGSGVLAVIVNVLILREHGFEADEAIGRLTGGVFWAVVELMVTGLTFGIIGLELRAVLEALGGDTADVLAEAAAVVATVVVVRGVWLFPAALAARRRNRRALDPNDPDVEDLAPVGPRETAVLWWAGMRGVATVALVLALPTSTDAGTPFPARDRLIVIAFAVVMVTLVVQGMTLAPLVKLLDVRESEDAAGEEEARLRVRAAKASLRRLKELAANDELPDELVDALRARQQAVIARVKPDAYEEEARQALAERRQRKAEFSRIEEELNEAAREELKTARGEPGADPVLVDRCLRRIDLRHLS
ncbi:Na+/H+ antiporter [Yinghuangia seranimata]|uniref:Na+/H+ antiporter n=1 Tax=Yinghuangia seranimata TaxID=408067 RepID=UPI00248C3C1A|nr:Na+/H+ antiporter [Yinghuangia seranimata]MDI2126204.1 Na+/H+ antiporter [Yinghuangia seranimata]